MEKVLVLLLAVAFAGAQEKECNFNLLDPCGEKMFGLFIQPETFPTTEAELKETCKKMDSGVECLKEVKKTCPDVISDNIAEAFISTARGNIDDICQDGTAFQKKIIKHGSCIRDKLSKNHTCVPTFIRLVEATRSLEKASRIPAICCGMVRFDKCYNEEVSSHCQSEAARTNRRIVQGFAIFLAEKCLTYLGDPKKCNSIPTPVLTGQLGVKTILPGLTAAIA